MNTVVTDMKNAVGIDVSKGKSTVAIMRPWGEVVATPYDVDHTEQDLDKLVELIHGLNGETRVVMEATGSYHIPVALALYEAGIYVSVVNPILIRQYGNNSVRRVKTDRKDAIKLANYAIDNWLKLPRFLPTDENRQLLKNYNRQCQNSLKLETAIKNNLISLLDNTFPNVNRLFGDYKKDDGSEKWVDFAEIFWHCECITDMTQKSFTQKYQKWCKKKGYRFSENKAEEIYAAAHGHVGLLPKSDTTKLLILQTVAQLKAILSSLAALRKEMQVLAETLPEYPVVMEMYGVGPSLGPQLMAEIGDVRRFYSKKALVAFAGIDAPPWQSGTMDIRSRNISKRGSPLLRKTLYQTMNMIYVNAPIDDPIYQFMSQKRAEGKPYKVCMMASANKFLRQYYATVTAYLNSMDSK